MIEKLEPATVWHFSLMNNFRQLMTISIFARIPQLIVSALIQYYVSSAMQQGEIYMCTSYKCNFIYYCMSTSVRQMACEMC